MPERSVNIIFHVDSRLPGTDGEIALVEGMCFKRLPQEAWAESEQMFGGRSLDMHSTVMSAPLKEAADGQVDEEHEGFILERMNRYLLAMAVHCGTSPLPLFLYFAKENPFDIYKSGYVFDHEFRSGTDDVFDPNMVAGIYDLINGVLDADDSKLQIALLCFHDSFLEQTKWQLRFLTVMSGIEALFGDTEPNEVTHKVSERVACFLGKPEQRIDAFTQFKKLYSIRSNIAHGKNSEDGTYEHFLELVKVLHYALRKILSDDDLRRFFTKASNPQFAQGMKELVFLGHIERIEEAPSKKRR